LGLLPKKIAAEVSRQETIEELAAGSPGRSEAER
jgi:hypothetical protein